MNLITGFRGFIGSNLFKKIGGDGIDLKDGQDIRIYIFKEKYNVIFHLAAEASIPKSFEMPVNSHLTNVLGTLEVLEYAKRTGARVVFSSSSSVYDPVSPYAVQKKMCEDYLKLYWSFGVKSVALRYFNVFGENQEIANGGNSLALARFMKQYKDNEPFTIYGTGEQRRDFIYVGDVVEANIKAAEYLDRAEKFETIDIGYGKNYSINEVLDMIDKNHPREYLPPRIEPFENLADISKAKELLGWSPKVSIKKWLRQSL